MRRWVSFGADTFDGDPISRFALRINDHAERARDIAGRGPDGGRIRG